MELDLEELAAIVELLDKTDFTEFVFERGDLRMVVRRGEPSPSSAGAAAAAVEDRAAVKPVVASPVLPEASRVAGPDEVVVRAPMLGTFYRSPRPGEVAFVEVGDKIDADSVVGIVEVMKLMNSVTAGIDGQIVEVIARDGALVEFNEPLFVVKQLP